MRKFVSEMEISQIFTAENRTVGERCVADEVSQAKIAYKTFEDYVDSRIGELIFVKFRLSLLNN